MANIYLENGKFPAYCWPGGYPLFYVSKKSEVVCPKCANHDMTENAFKDECGNDLDIVTADANWEDPRLYCDICEERIESAYAEDEVETDI